jgi:hypothetical protein
MVDKQTRLQAASLIRDFKSGRITNDQFAVGFPRSGDRAIGAINSMLWFYYDDLRTHRLTGKWSLSEERAQLFDRCALFLPTDLEYHGEANFVSIFAPFQRLWFSLTRKPEPKIDLSCWPFDNQTQMESSKRSLGGSDSKP